MNTSQHLLPMHSSSNTADSRSKLCAAGLAGVAAFVATIAVVNVSTQGSAAALYSVQPAVSTQSATLSRPVAIPQYSSIPRVQRAVPYAAARYSEEVEAPVFVEANFEATAPKLNGPLIALVSFASAVVAGLAVYFRPKAELSMMATSGQRSSVSPMYAEEWRPGQGTSLGSLFNTPAKGGSKGGATAAPKEEVEYFKDMEVTPQFAVLKQFLADGEWEEADNEHRRLLIELAGPEAVARDYVWPTEIGKISEADMKMLDDLWLNYSGGKFGFSVQRKLWTSTKGNWVDFFDKINWFKGENKDYRSWAQKDFIYSLDAERGHLPLTSALRGTSLMLNIYEHPAFGGPFKKKQVRK